MHVTGRRGDGYHEIDSLVAFAEVGDELTVAPGSRDDIAISGPFAGDLAGLRAGENIVARASEAARAVAAGSGIELAGLAIRIEKHLPVASGIGGGSADAAALLRIVADAMPQLRAGLRRASLALGADVPMCFDGIPSRVSGIGEIGRPLRRLPAVPILLANPRVPVATPDVFKRLRQREQPPLPDLPDAGFGDVAGVLAYLEGTRNDLQAAATEIVPEIAIACRTLHGAGAGLVRMSGSGATVFGIFTTSEAVNAAAELFRSTHPGWWCAATRLHPASFDKDRE